MFLPKRAEGGDARSPWGPFWFEPVSRFTRSGMRVSADQAMRLAAVYACVSILAKTFAVLPQKLYQPSATGRTPITDHWLYKLLAKRPNAFQSPFEWRQMTIGHFALRGNAYNEIYSNGAGEVTDLIPRHPDRVTPEVLSNGDYRYRYHQADGSTRIIPRGQMWHLRGLSQDGITGMNPIEYQRESIGIGLAAQDYGARFFANDGSPPGWIELPGKFKDQTAAEEFREKWRKAQAGGRRGSTAVLEGGMKYHDIPVKNSDAQFLETRQFSVTDICRIFGVPPHMVADLEGANFATVEQMSLDYVTFTLVPIGEAWKSSVSFTLLQDDDDLEPDVDVSRLLAGDQAARAAFYTKLFGLGALSTNDIRRREGENDVEGGDNRFVPVNLRLLKADMDDPPPPAPGTHVPGPPGTNDLPTGDPDGEGGDSSEDREERASKLASAAAARIARREWAVISEAFKRGGLEAVRVAYAKHATFVAECLAVSSAAARSYCAGRLCATEPTVTQDDFEMSAQCQLERLAMKGDAYAR